MAQRASHVLCRLQILAQAGRTHIRPSFPAGVTGSLPSAGEKWLALAELARDLPRQAEARASAEVIVQTVLAGGPLLWISHSSTAASTATMTPTIT
jgi:hypothetical protein